MGALSFSPSPITTTPSMATVSSIRRMASTAAWSAASLSPRPIQRPAASAAASVTRTTSRARLRSGAALVTARLGCLRDESGKLDQPLDQVSLLGGEIGARPGRDTGLAGVPENARNARVRVLHVVDG